MMLAKKLGMIKLQEEGVNLVKKFDSEFQKSILRNF